MDKASDERLTPDQSDYDTLWEHVARYAYACSQVGGLSVLDLACGEGYGTYSMSLRAENVIGIDVDQLAVEMARKKYGVDCRVGCAEKIPIPSNTIDCVVSFETIEHLADAPAFLQEVSRVLKSGGNFILSTPNRNCYHAKTAANPYHLKEYDLNEICGLVAPLFTVTMVYGQSFQRSPMDWIEEKLACISGGLSSLVRNQVTRRLRNRYTPGVITTSEVDMRNFIEAIPTRHRWFTWWFNRLGLRRVDLNSNPKCTYFVLVAHKRED